MRQAVGFVCAVASLGLMAISVFMNCKYVASVGSTDYESYALGAASICFDLLRGGMPIIIAGAAAKKNWSAVLLGSVGLCLLSPVSLGNAIGFLSSNRAAVVGDQKALNASLATSENDLKSLEAQFATLEAHRAPAVVNEDLARLKQDRRFASPAECTNATTVASREFCTSFFTLKRELALGLEGQRLEKARDEIRKAAATLEGKGAGKDADPQATLLSSLMPFWPADHIDRDWAVFVALVIEFSAGFGLYLSMILVEYGHEPMKVNDVKLLNEPSPTAQTIPSDPLETLSSATKTPKKLRRIRFTDDDELFCDE